MTPKFSVSDFIEVTNQSLEIAFGVVEVEGEVASFKVNQQKYVFFDLKDEAGLVSCFMTVWQLRTALEDGMRVVVQAKPKLTQKGRFSLTVQSIRPVGEGSIAKNFELLRAKLDKEGLFAPERKRMLPKIPQKVAVISSVDAAGYGDFIKIVNQRWGGLEIDVANAQVQGLGAEDQIIRALDFFNQKTADYQLIVIIRGGGSADDLQTFNDERLVRAIAASKLPTLVGVGHECDVSLADLAADVRASTPSNAAQILVPDRREISQQLRSTINQLARQSNWAIDQQRLELSALLKSSLEAASAKIDQLRSLNRAKLDLLTAYDPDRVLGRGYALIRGVIRTGEDIDIETKQLKIKAEVKNVNKK